MYKFHFGRGNLPGLLAVVACFALSCASGLYAPRPGVTEQFFRGAEDELIEVNTYDFSRLENGYGLCVFSYELRGSRGNNITGWKPEEKTGIRVWEHKFSANEWDVKIARKKFKYWGYRSFMTLGLTKAGYEVAMHLTFHKNRVVYGGRLVVDSRTYFTDGPQVEFHFDEDMRPWLEAYGNQIADIKIDTVMMGAGY